MNKPEQLKRDDDQLRPPVFVSFSSANQGKALELCAALEERGTPCWISCRDVAPGENYQESIVRAIAGARSMVLVFSKAANGSDEIKKELSLASRYRIPVLAVRIEDVQPTDAFAYELSTRQWIDAFAGWDKALDAIVRRLDNPSASASARTAQGLFVRPGSRRRRAMLASALALLLIVGGGWWWTQSAAVRPLTLGFAGFQAIGAGVAPGATESVNQEVKTALSDQQIPLQANGSDFVLHGSVEQQPDGMKLTATLDDARAGATLWSKSEEVDEKQGLTPHVYGLVLGLTVGCVLDRLAHEPKPAKAVLSLFVQACYLDSENARGGQLLDVGRQMTASAPRFTGGWWAIAQGAQAGATLVRLSGGSSGDSNVIDDKARAEGAAAARQLIRLAPNDAAGYRLLASLLPGAEAVEKEKLFRESIATHPEKCMCGYQEFGDFLIQSGRINDALAIYQRGLDQGAVAALAHWRVAMAQYLLGERSSAAEAMQDMEKAVSGPQIAEKKRPLVAMWDRRWKDAVGHFHFANPDDQKAVDAALEALASGDPQRIDLAGRRLEQVPTRLETEFQIVPLLASLGRTNAVFGALDLSFNRHGFYSAPGIVAGMSNPLLFDPRFRPLWNDPRFAAYLQKAGFIAYWKQSRSRPDACDEANPPPFCRMI